MLNSHQTVPPGGWRYLQGNINLIAANRADLIMHIKDHRKNNGIPEGDVEQDLEDQLLQRLVKSVGK